MSLLEAAPGGPLSQLWSGGRRWWSRGGPVITKRGPNSRECRFGHLDPGTVEILLQTGIELGQSAVLEVRNTLLLGLDITSGAKFVGRHGDGRGVEVWVCVRGCVEARDPERGDVGGSVVWTTGVAGPVQSKIQGNGGT